MLDHLNRGWQGEFLLSFPIFVELLLGQVLHMTLKKKKKNSLQQPCYYDHFRDEETEGQRSKMSNQKPSLQTDSEGGIPRMQHLAPLSHAALIQDFRQYILPPPHFLNFNCSYYGVCSTCLKVFAEVVQIKIKIRLGNRKFRLTVRCYMCLSRSNQKTETTTGLSKRRS